MSRDTGESTTASILSLPFSGQEHREDIGETRYREHGEILKSFMFDQFVKQQSSTAIAVQALHWDLDFAVRAAAQPQSGFPYGGTAVPHSSCLLPY